MTTRKRSVVVAVVLSCAGVARAGDVHMTDIQALAKASAWAELLDKAIKVAPSERDATWNDLVAKAAVGRLSDGAYTDRVATQDAQALLEAYPHLANNHDFMEARARRGLIAYGGCFRDAYDTQVCNREALAFVRGDPKNAELARDMGSVVARSTTPKSPAVDYFHQAVSIAHAAGEAGTKLVKETCSSTYFIDATASALAGVEHADPLIAKTNELVFDWCWPHIDHDAFAKAALSTDLGYVNGCPGLLAKKALTGVRDKKCKAAVKK